MKYRKTFREAWDETKLQGVNEQEEKQDSEEVRRLKDELQQMKVKYNKQKLTTQRLFQIQQLEKFLCKLVLVTLF